MARKNKEPEVNQPNIEQQQEYISLRDNDATMVLVRGKKFNIRWVKKGQMVKLGRLLLRKPKYDTPVTEQEAKDETPLDASEIITRIKEDAKLSCKASAIYLLDGFWKLKFNYWWLWRWFYYIKQYSDDELKDLLMEGKKKVPLKQFLEATILLTEAKDTVMMMRTEEAERILHELTTAQRTQPQKE